MTKRWLDTLVVSSVRFVKGALALALCLGTLGVALTFVGVSPAAAAGVPTITSIAPSSGLPAGGTKVTITGTNLTSATAVDFGTAAATISSNTAGKIVIDASPPGTGTVDITVTTAAGTSAIVPADEFTYVNAPTVTQLFGGNAPTSGGTTIIIQGTNFVGVTAVDFATTAAAAGTYTVQSSTQIQAVVPAIASETVGDIYNVTVTTGAGVSPKATANQWYWFGSGSCTFSGTGVENSGAPPGSSAYIQGAVAGTSSTLPSGGTAIPTACTGLSGLGTTAPMLESLGSPAAAIVTGTGPGGNGGNEEWLGWSGANSYSDTTSSTYNAPAPGFQLPPSGPSTTGGCPVAHALCVTAGAGGTPTYYGTDPGASCPPSQAETDAGLVDCDVTALTAQSGSPPDSYVVATLQLSYADDPTPDPATATFTSSTTAPGSTVTLNSCSTCNWWGAGSSGAPSFLPPIGPAPATATAVPAPTVWVGSTRASAVEASTTTDTIAITPAAYACGSSGGANTTSPGPTANCTLSQGTISGSFVMPTVSCTTCNVYVDEPNLSLTQSTYGADGGTGTYNSGLTYQLVNSVESKTAISCPTCGGGSPGPTVTGVSPSSGPTAGGTSVTVSGTNLTGATAVDFGTGHPGTSISGVTATSLTVTSPAGTGTVDVTVTTPNGTSAINAPSDQFTYNAPALPTVTGVSPSSGPAAGGTSVTVSGTNLTGATAVDFGTANPGTSISGVTATSLTVTSPAGTGTVNVTVTTPNGTSAVNAPSDQFTYAPTVTAVSPNNGPQGGTNTVTVTGTGFVSGSTAVDFGTNAGTSVDVTSSTSLSVVVPSGTGTVSVTVITTGGGSSTPLASAYTYNAPALPTVTGVSPASGPTAGGTSVTVSGTNLTGATAVDFGSGQPGHLDQRGHRHEPHGHLSGGTGTVNVTVTTPNGTSAVNAPSDQFTYNAPALPTVTGVSPSSGPTAGGTSVTVSGTNLTGATAVDFGTANPGTSISGVTATSLTVTSPSGTGTVNVTVTTPNGTSAVNAPSDQFTYNAPALPTVTGVSPSSGPTAGGTSVTVSGTNLTGATAVDFGTGHPGTSISGVTATSLTVTSPAGTGTVNVTVTTPNGTSAVNAPSDQFTYNAPALPTVTGVSPASGPTAGGTSVTVSGTNLTGATAVDFGTGHPGTSISGVTATSLTVTSPSGHRHRRRHGDHPQRHLGGQRAE